MNGRPDDGVHGPSPEPAQRTSRSSTRVFITYAHEDAAHDDAVRNLWLFLRANGVDAQLDRPASERRQDWPLWMLKQVRDAAFVLVIASPAYRRRSEGEAGPSEGRGVQWEAALIREYVYADRHAALGKFLPVLLPGRSNTDIPTWLGPTSTTHYSVTAFSTAGTEKLLRVLTQQPYETEPAIGQAPILPARSLLEEQPHGGHPRDSLSKAAATISAATSRQNQAEFIAVARGDPTDSRLIAPLTRLFLHYFDPHFLDEVSHGRNAQLVTAEAIRATRLAVLAAETVFLPAASYIESDLCARTINEYRPLFETGQIVLVGGEANIVDFATAKLLQYEEDSDRFRRYEAVLSSNDITPPFRSRTRSATGDIVAGWYDRLADLSPLLIGLPTAMVANLESRWAAVPTRLEGRAFTPEYAIPVLLETGSPNGAEIIVARRAGSHINSEYFRSYTRELGAGVVTDLSYLYSPHTHSLVTNLPFRRIIQHLSEQRILELVMNSPPEDLLALRGNAQVATAITRALAGVRTIRP